MTSVRQISISAVVYSTLIFCTPAHFLSFYPQDDYSSRAIDGEERNGKLARAPVQWCQYNMHSVFTKILEDEVGIWERRRESGARAFVPYGLY